MLEYEESAAREDGENDNKNRNDHTINVRPYSDLFKNIGLGFSIMISALYFKYHMQGFIIVLIVFVLLIIGVLFITFSLVDFFKNHAVKWAKGCFKWPFVIFVAITFALVLYFCNNMIVEMDHSYNAPVKCIIDKQ